VNTVKCPLCHVDVPFDKIDLPNRCLHPQCPLNKREGKCLIRNAPRSRAGGKPFSPSSVQSMVV
jgi:hypothetical protein